MDSRLTGKLFHTLVVLGVGLTAVGCGDDDSTNTGSTQQKGSGTSSGTVAQNTSTSSGTAASTTSSGTAGSSTSSTSGSSTPGWACCG